MTGNELLAALDWLAGRTVLAPSSATPGCWVGAPSAVAHDGFIYLAYRIRRPVGEGRGFANVIARSVDGIRLETLAIIERERHRAESLERPCLVRIDNGWRLYISCATAHSKHWRVDMLEADSIEGLPGSTPVTVLAGDNAVGVKDPVILRDSAGWHLWALDGPQFFSPFGSGGLRYLCAVTDPAGGLRVYYESACADGSHELRTQLIR